MGLCGSKHHGMSLYAVNPELKKWRGDFSNLGLDGKDLWKLWDVFAGADKDNSGEISLVEMLDFLHIDRTRFTKRVFSIFDEDMSGEIDFREFVISTWNYCTLSKPSLVMFAFDLYDEDGSGCIEMDEMKQMLREVYGKKFESTPLAYKILEKMDKMSSDLAFDPNITVHRFGKFCETHPGLLYPAFAFQYDLRHRVVGHSFWEKMINKRVELSDGKEVQIRQLLKAHVDETTFQVLAAHDDDAVVHVKHVDGTEETVYAKDMGNHHFKETQEITGTLAARRTKLMAAGNLAIATALISSGKDENKNKNKKRRHTDMHHRKKEHEHGGHHRQKELIARYGNKTKNSRVHPGGGAQRSGKRRSTPPKHHPGAGDGADGSGAQRSGKRRNTPPKHHRQARRGTVR